MAFVFTVLALVCQCSLFGNAEYDNEHSALLQAGIKNHVGGSEIGNNSKHEAVECTYKVGDTVKIIGLGKNGQDCIGQTRTVAYCSKFSGSVKMGGPGCHDEWFRPDSLESAVAEATGPKKICCYENDKDWWYDHKETWPHKDEWFKIGNQIMMEDYVVYKGTRSIQGPDDCLQVCLDWESECNPSYDVTCRSCNEVSYTYSWPAANQCRVGVGQNGLGWPASHSKCDEIGWGACVAMTNIAASSGRKRCGGLAGGCYDSQQYNSQNAMDMISDQWR